MLAYAPVRHDTRMRPGTLALIVGAHVAVISLALAAKFQAELRPVDPPIEVYKIPVDPTKPPPEPTKPSKPIETVSQVDTTRLVIPQPGPTVDQQLTDPPPSGPVVGTIVEPYVPPTLDPPPVRRTKAVFKTAASDIRPPYPESKRTTDQEAKLRLKLAIDARGRVVGVEPVGRVDPTFFEAARRHILKYWRYTPATENGQAVATSMTVSLDFQLDG